MLPYTSVMDMLEKGAIMTDTGGMDVRKMKHVQVTIGILIVNAGRSLEEVCINKSANLDVNIVLGKVIKLIVYMMKIATGKGNAIAMDTR